MTIEDEAEAIYNSIVDRNKKRETYARYSNIMSILFLILFFGGMLLLGMLEEYLSTATRGYLPIFWFLIILFVVYLAKKFENIVIFNSDTEKLFFHLYDAWKKRYDEESKLSMTLAVREIEKIIEEYGKLPYTAELVETLNQLKKNLKSYVYGNLGVSYTGKSSGDSERLNKGWELLKNLSIQIFKGISVSNASINEIKQTNATFGKFFTKQEKIKLIDEKEPKEPPILRAKNWCTIKYNESVRNRFIFWLILTLVGDYYLYAYRGIEIQYLIYSAVIPIMAPSYLVERH